MRQVAIDSFINFVSETDALGGGNESLFIFRGQPLKGKLLPSVARSNRRQDTATVEKETMDQLRLMGSTLLPQNYDTLDLLVLAQHYRLKTRLLDWTSNPLAALWFACADNKPGDVFVYALKADDFLAQNVYSEDPFSRSKTRVFQPRLNNNRIIAQHGWFTLHRFSNKTKTFVALEKTRR